MSTIRETIEKNGYIIHSIKGDSMMPMLDENKDVVKIVKVERPLKLYDLPLYERDGKLILHRIIKVKKNGYVCCGDNRWQTEVVKPEQIIGVTSAYLKDDNWISVEDEDYKKYVLDVTGKRKEREKASKQRKGMQNAIPNSIPDAVYDLLKVYRFALTDVDVSLSEKPNYERMFKIAKRHGIDAVCFSYIEKHKEEVPDEVYVTWKNAKSMIQRRNLLFEAERTEIFEALESNGIRYIPLKGILLNPLYPVKNVRYSSDNDIFYDKSKTEEVISIMKEREYECHTGQDVHDSYYKEPIFNFEFHKSLFVKEKSFGHVFDHPFEFSSPVTNFHFEMKIEYFVAYNLAHFYKHYYGGGSGFRYFGDVYVMKKEIMNESFDFDLFHSILDKAHLRDFYDYVSHIVEALFDSVGDISKEDLVYILGNGLYGTMSNHIKNGVKEQGKGKYIWGRLFPGYHTMKQRYRFLKFLPILLPLMWVVRIITFLLETDKRKVTIQAIKE